MKNYEIRYIDEDGYHADYEIKSTDARLAMETLFELVPQARRILYCKRKPIAKD